MRGEADRYGLVTLEDGGVVLIDTLALLDFLCYRSRLRDRNLRKTVPEYRPKEWAKRLGKE